MVQAIRNLQRLQVYAQMDAFRDSVIVVATWQHSL